MHVDLGGTVFCHALSAHVDLGGTVFCHALSAHVDLGGTVFCHVLSARGLGGNCILPRSKCTCGLRAYKSQWISPRFG